MEFVWFALIGICAGWLAGRLTKTKDLGLVGNLAVGIIGAVLGGWGARELGFHEHGMGGLLVVATLGAIVLLFLLRFVPKKGGT